MKLRNLYIVFLLVAFISCGKDNPEKGGDKNEPHIVDGVAPKSGGILTATLDGGLAPLSFTKTISNACVGYVYSGFGALPDLFFQCPTGVSSGNGIKTCLGLNLCKFEGFTPSGQPLYSAPISVQTPWSITDTSVKIIEYNGRVLAFFLASATRIRIAEYNPETQSFGSSWSAEYINLSGLEKEPLAFDIALGSGNSADLLIMCSDTDGSYKPEMDDVSESYYDSAGIYRGKMYYANVFRINLDLTALRQNGSPAKLNGDAKVILAPTGIAAYKGKSSIAGCICLNKFGVLKYLPSSNSAQSSYLQDATGAELVNPFGSGNITALKAKDSAETQAFIVTGEGYPRYYKSTGRTDSNGSPIFEGPIDVLMKSGDLYAGSLPVPSVADWDGDGVLDIVTGNSEGRLLFFKNWGSNAEPAFGREVRLCSQGQEICFRAGYYEVQGPFEAAWGYLCPVVFDWDGDGLKDIVFSGNEGKFEFMLNEGSKSSPCLGRRQGIYLDGLELYGMWRVRPAVARVDGRVLIAMMDGEDALHLYEKAGANSVKDLGCPTLSDGKYIYGHRETANSSLGERGREKLEFADWDGDGVLDLIIGTPLQASVPDPAKGLPWSRTTRGLQTMWLKNIGSNSSPKYSYPRQFLFRGADFHIGIHANGPTACMLGNISGGKPNLLVSGEGGKFFFFDRNDLTELSLW